MRNHNLPVLVLVFLLGCGGQRDVAPVSPGGDRGGVADPGKLPSPQVSNLSGAAQICNWLAAASQVKSGGAVSLTISDSRIYRANLCSESAWGMEFVIAGKCDASPRLMMTLVTKKTALLRAGDYCKQVMTGKDTRKTRIELSPDDQTNEFECDKIESTTRFFDNGQVSDFDYSLKGTAPLNSLKVAQIADGTLALTFSGAVKLQQYKRYSRSGGYQTDTDPIDIGFSSTLTLTLKVGEEKRVVLSHKGDRPELAYYFETTSDIY